MSMLEFTSEAELRAHYIAVRARVKAWKPPAVELPPSTPIFKGVDSPPVSIVVTTNSRKPWLVPLLMPAVKTLDRVKNIQRLVGIKFNMTVEELLTKNQSPVVAWPRQIAMYLCVTSGKKSLGYVGSRFGGRDHSTCSHARDKVATQRLTDPELDATLKELEAELQT